GRGIFTRSYYEETVVVRVHPDLMEKLRVPPELVNGGIWKQRYREIRIFEQYLTANGVAIRKFFLHVSRGEQRKRFLMRLDDSAKNWKFSEKDAAERKHWRAYMQAY